MPPANATPTTYEIMVRFAASLLICTSMLISFSGCESDHGLSKDVIRHFETEGIQIEPLSVHAKAWSRSGHIIAKHSPEQVAKIVEAFRLAAIAPGSDEELALTIRWNNHSETKLSGWVEAWGISGRPKEFRLQNGGQLEYFYLIVTQDGRMYLFAEYAYS